jgi:hypothetical protein
VLDYQLTIEWMEIGRREYHHRKRAEAKVGEQRRIAVRMM